MACGDTILSLAQNVWEDIGSPSGVTVTYISGWMVSDSNVGKLNNVLSTCFSGYAGCIGPDFNPAEQSIYGELYKQIYWQQQINSNLGAGGIMWTEMQEGDSRIRRASPTEVAKVYKDMWKESTQNLNRLVASYRINASYARSNDFAPP